MNNNNTNFFVIISPPRCRSTYLRGLLSSHPDVACHNEIFHENETSLHLQKSNTNAYLFDTTWRDNNPNLFVEQVIDETKNQCPSAILIGCKMLLIENQIHGLDALLKLKPRVITLTRHNKLAWYSSLKIAIETRVWATNNYPTLQHKVIFNEKEFQEWNGIQFQLEQNAHLKLKENNLHSIKFDYEELTKDSTIKKILDFLHLSNANLSPDIVEQNSKHILSRFNNPQEAMFFASAINQPSWLD